MLSMTLQQLKYVIETVNKGSMNEAAKSLFISQPSLSNAIKELETELGIQIFLRTNKGIHLSSEGGEFLGYARQVVEQAQLLEQRYFNSKPAPQNFTVSTQHYAFAVNAFVDLVKKYGLEEYRYTLKESRTYEIIEDVKNLKSEIGILYLSSFNEKVLKKLIRENDLVFHLLFETKPYIFISKENPLAKKKKVYLEDLVEYPCLSFDQGEYNSFYFSEEILSTLSHKKDIHVSDRATLFNFLIGLNGYTISTGILSSDLNGTDIVSIPLEVEETMAVGWLSHKNTNLSKLGTLYIDALEAAIKGYEL